MNHFLDLYTIKTMIRTTKLFVKSDGEFVLSPSDKSKDKEIPLWFLMNNTEPKYRAHFLSFFLKEEINFSKDLTVKNLVLGLNHWYDFLNTYCFKSFEDYVTYFQKDNKNKDNEFCTEVHFSKIREIKKHTKTQKGIELNELFKNYDKYKIETDSYNLAESIYSELVVSKNGNVIQYGSDPCIDVNFFKDAKIVLNKTAKFIGTDNIINSMGNSILKNEEQDEFLKRKYGQEYFVKTNVIFTLDDVLEVLSSLLYFESPLTQEEQQENASDFCEEFQEMQVEMELNIFDRTPPHEKLFNEFFELFSLEKNKHKH